MLGRAGGLAHHGRGKRGERRRGQSGCLCFIWKLPSAGDPWTTSPGSCVARRRARIHTHTPHTQLEFSLPVSLELHFHVRDPMLCLSSPAFWKPQMRVKVCSRPPLAECWSWLGCLFCSPSRAAAFAGIVFSHTVLTQHCL